jgi:autotransporter-associated beta strand protein
LELAGQSGGNGWLRGAVTVNSGGTLLFSGGDGTGFGWNSPATSLHVNGGTFNAAGGAHVGFGGSMNVTLSNGGTISGTGQWNGDGLLSFSSSGDSTNTWNGSWVMRGDNGANHTFNVADGAAAVDLQVNASLGDQYPEVGWVPASALIKTGTGTMVMAGDNSFNGATTVSAGTLVVNGNISTSSLTTVDNGATLQGNGTVGTTTVNGVFAPGNSIDTFNVIGTLTLNGISNFEIDPTLGVGLDRSADLANVTGAVSYGGILNVLYGGDAANFTAGMSFNLFDATLGFSNSFSTVNLPSLTGGLTWEDNLSTNGTIVVVPEPSAALLGGLGLLALLRRRR